MMPSLQLFHFLQPWWLLALLPLPLAWWLAGRRDPAERELARLIDPALLPHLLQGRRASRRLPLGLFALGWVLAVIALAGPAWSRVDQPLYASRASQVVALSLSQHMLSRDVTPSRLERARFKVRDLLQSNRDGLNGLIGYAGEAFVVAPLTSDAESLGELLSAMSPDTMPVDGDDAAAAIERAAHMVREANAGEGSLILVTDQADAAAEAAARKALASGLRVSVLGVGTTAGGPVPLAGGGFLRDAQGGMAVARRDDRALAALAAAGGGRYVPMTADRSDIDRLHGELREARPMASVGDKGEGWLDRGPWLLLPLLLIAALAFRRGWLLVLPLLWLPLMPGTAQAVSWRDLWQRPDQQAAQALAAGDAQRAEQLARDPAWRAAAQYRAGDFDAAAKTLKGVTGADAAYNLGNALAKQGRYQEAIEAYDRALHAQPTHADATANREAVEAWLRKQNENSDSEASSQPPQNGEGEGESSQSSSDDTSGEGRAKSESSKEGQRSDAKPSEALGEGDEAQHAEPSAAPPEGEDADKKQAGSQSPDPNQDAPDAGEQAEQKAAAERAQQALKAQMDAALAESGEPQQPETHELGATSADDTTSSLPPEIQRALQRVPDDPGALLRRKFQLEYQQRHSGARNEDRR